MNPNDISDLSDMTLTRSMQPTIEVKILKAFISARQGVSTQLMEENNGREIQVKTYHQHDAEGNLLCEDVVVESRPLLLELESA